MTERTRGGVIRSIEFYFLCPGIRHRDLFYTRAETPALFPECAMRTLNQRRIKE